MPLETIEIPREDPSGVLALLQQFKDMVRMAQMLAAYYHALRLQDVPESVAAALTAHLQETLFLQGAAANQGQKEGEAEQCSE